MASITLDIEEGHSASHDLISGWDYTRAAMVEGLSPALSTDDLIVQSEALLVAAVGNRGSRYQMGSSGIYVYLKAFVPEIIVGSDLLPTGAVKYRIVYRGYPILLYEFDGALNQVEANLDTNGTIIAVSYTYPANYNTGNTSLAGTRQIQSVLIQRDEPEPIFSFSFLVTSGSLSVHIRGHDFILTNANATDIMSAIVAFSGTCNDATYTIGVIVGTKHQWKIVHVAADSKDQGLTYYAKMYMQYRPSGWDKTATFINPDTGRPPADLIVSNVKVTDSQFPQYAGNQSTGTPDIGSTLAFTVDESTFPSFGSYPGATFPDVNN